MKVALCDIKAPEARRKHGSIEGLKVSIADVGLINPLTIDSNGSLLAGRRRFQAVSELGWLDVECYVLPTDNDPLKAFRIALLENLERKQLTEVEEAIAIKEYDSLMRQLQGESKAGRPSNTIGQSLTDFDGWSQAKTAKDLGVSKPTVNRDIAIATAIERYPDLAKHTDGQGVLRDYKRREIGTIAPVTGQYRTIVIDPPWPMEKIERAIDHGTDSEMDYPTMSLDEIKSLPVSDVAMDDCHLFLWTTQKFLPYAFDILKGWGFTYVFTMVWHKAGGFQPFGLPQYNCEFALFGRKGDLPFLDTKGFNTCFTGARREHSRKPKEFDDLIRRVSPEPRIDYFGREPKEGFTIFGNEPDRF